MNDFVRMNSWSEEEGDEHWLFIGSRRSGFCHSQSAKNRTSKLSRDCGVIVATTVYKK